ncbi:Ankyrin repeat region domain-containing protein [Forsythia ovata]|uniref:Ankyrin repeat region domain-containing protein n=1 Tax=Forsythia ovata TaxID=205694 RepID=A0ABD1W8B4_9LAMI
MSGGRIKFPKQIKQRHLNNEMTLGRLPPLDWTDEINLNMKYVFEAAAAGNMNYLRKLLQEDPLILDRVVVNCLHETTMHIAALFGHTDFVREILRRRPEFARELNLHLLSLLHLASAKGYAEVAMGLIYVNAQSA